MQQQQQAMHQQHAMQQAAMQQGRPLMRPGMPQQMGVRPVGVPQVQVAFRPVAPVFVTKPKVSEEKDEYDD
jgi:hypothetical protein